MADYWKSQERKFCEFCKCWITNNKPSVEFHEKGKRHKDNVAKKIKDISKKSYREERDKQKMDMEIRKMEQAAMTSYMMKDVKSKRDYSSQFVTIPNELEGKCSDEPTMFPTVPTPEQYRAQQIREQQQAAAASSAQKVQIPKVVLEDLPAPKKPTAIAITTGPDNLVKHVKSYIHQKKLPKWYEAKTEDGNIYYWHTITKATSWEKPADGYVSIELQQRNSNEDKEKVKKKEEQWEIMRNPLKNPLPATEKRDPYGQWQTIRTVNTEETPDLQLPIVERVELKVPEYEDEEPEIKFKEKVITSIGSTGGSTSEVPAFKKRKVQKFNARQRTDDD